MQGDKKMQDSGGLLKDHQPVPTNFTYDHSFLHGHPQQSGTMRTRVYSNTINSLMKSTNTMKL